MKYFSIFFEEFKKILYYPIINTLFPNLCFNCNKNLSLDNLAACPDCLNLVRKTKDYQRCGICSAIYLPGNTVGCYYCSKLTFPPYHFDKVFSPFVYEEVIRLLIVNGKYFYRKSIWELLAKLLAHALKDFKLELNAVLIPVPISKTRLMERGFNQSLILAKKLHLILKLPYSNQILIKAKNNKSQLEISHKERLTNPSDYYKIKNTKLILNKTVYLVDDVFTTGTTLNECARLLKTNGAKNVIAITIAKTLFLNKSAKTI